MIESYSITGQGRVKERLVTLFLLFQF